jgi:hypothetical protein
MRLLKSLLPLLLTAATLPAATLTVASLAELQTAIDNANPGDEIVVKNQAYTAFSAINIARQGTAAQPILVRAETVGGVEIRGPNGFNITSPAAFIVIQGFMFTHSRNISLPVGTHHCRFTGNVFELQSESGAWISISGDDHQFDHNIVRNKNTPGQMLTVRGPGSSGMAQRTWIRRNLFQNFTNDQGGNGFETLQVGLSGRSLTDAYTLVEENLFIRTDGENEMISNKSSSNTYRFNTVRDTVGELTLRHGDDCTVYGNYFINSHGVRFFGKNHRIFSNHFHLCNPALQIGNGNSLIPPGELTGFDRPDNVEFTFNTLVENVINAVMGARTGGLGAVGLVFANNIIQGGGRAVDLRGPVTDARWEGNIVWNTTGAGAIPQGGYRAVDPLLIADSNGAFHLQPSSPAIDAAVGEYAYATADMDGQPRDSPRDVGADEFSSAPVTNRILTIADVGPHASDLSPNFSIAASPGSRYVLAGQQARYTVSVVSSPGFSGAVNLRITGLPDGATATFEPASVTISGTSTLTITTPPWMATAGDLTISATTEGGAVYTTPILLVVSGAASAANVPWPTMLRHTRSSSWN